MRFHCATEPQARQRRRAPSYGRKKRLVRDLWLASLLVMPLLSLAATLALGLATTFLGLAILDESA